jgi:hypothetical protein
MTTIQVSVPDDMKLFIEEQIARGGFRSESEYSKPSSMKRGRAQPSKNLRQSSGRDYVRLQIL